MKIEIENSSITMIPLSPDSHELTVCDRSLGVYHGDVLPRIGESVMVPNDNTTYLITNIITQYGDVGGSPNSIKLIVKPTD